MKKLIIAAAVTTAALSTSAMAVENPFYFGLDFGQYKREFTAA